MDDTDITYDEIQDVLDGILQNQSFSFADLVHTLFHGEGEMGIPQIIWNIVKDVVEAVTGQNRLIFYLLALALIGAVFTNFANMLRKKQVAQTAFYATYMLFFSTLVASYQVIITETARELEAVVSFMKALVPAYFMSLAFATDAASSAVFYQLTLLAIGLVEMFLQKVALPAINIYFVIQLANQIATEPRMNKMAELIEKGIHWGLKSIFVFVIGLQVIQGLVLPEISAAKKNLLIRMGGAVPGVGNTFTSAAETILSSASLLKGAIGAAGLLGLTLVCVVPIAKLAFDALLYYVVEALIQPVADKRILGSVEGMTASIRLLLHMAAISGILFFISIAIVSTLGRT